VPVGQDERRAGIEVGLQSGGDCVFALVGGAVGA
jgi:hypothetical protein